MRSPAAPLIRRSSPVAAVADSAIGPLGLDDLLQMKQPGENIHAAATQQTFSGGDVKGGGISMLTRRAVLIGTAGSIRPLIALYRAEHKLRCPVGCIIIGAPATSGDQASEELGFIGGVQVLGGQSELANIHQAVGLSVAIISLDRGSLARQQVLSRCIELGLPVREAPTLADSILTTPQDHRHGLARGPNLLSNINLSELIGRTPHGIDRRAVSRALEGKRVLVTGAGGSIGSEICRIVATFAPQELILVERSENALFEIDRLIGARFPLIARRAVLHDCTDEEGTLGLFMRARPDAVFHAAAHKHVPLMEDHPSAAIINNVLGTKSVADASVAAGAERFVMISSDKAVNPSSIMGATKRLAEMYVQGLGRSEQRVQTHLCMVRFGNVLGSACSVLPIWSAQLAEGGPITVTDPRMTRYFMTIHEAAALVIQSSTIEHPDSSIYVLDMGKPVHILELAERFVRMCGYDPQHETHGDILPQADRNITNPADASPSRTGGPKAIIRLTGARPGEKLHEELAYDAENLEPTAYSGISSLRRSASHATEPASGGGTWENAQLIAQLRAAATGDAANAAATVRRLVLSPQTAIRAAA